MATQFTLSEMKDCQNEQIHEVAYHSNKVTYKQTMLVL